MTRTGGRGAQARRRARRQGCSQQEEPSCLHCIFCEKVLAPEYVAHSLKRGNLPRKCYFCTSFAQNLWARGHADLVRLLMKACTGVPVLNGSASEFHPAEGGDFQSRQHPLIAAEPTRTETSPAVLAVGAPALTLSVLDARLQKLEALVSPPQPPLRQPLRPPRQQQQQQQQREKRGETWTWPK
mmetsp:Transcript_4716/g.8079  ORF Transcript_4716/g.8079 Transcript_4716/m.8079 type:complete len:184 (-) Transcript_4716:306-857(-)